MKYDILSDLIITDINSVSTIYNKRNTEAKRKDRPCWAIIIKYEGETVYTSNGKQYRSDRNNMVILPKGSSYEWRCVKSGHYSVIEFESYLKYGEILSFPINNSETILKAFKNLEIKRTLNSPYSRLECIRDTYSILLMLISAQPKKYIPSEKQQKLAPVLDHIAKHYNEKLTNDMLAAKIGLSTVYFRKLFSEVVGQAPIDYIRSVKIQKAKEMLKSDYGSITDIALTLGYQNIYDFSRAFKKHTGVSPKAFKESSES